MNITKEQALSKIEELKEYVQNYDKQNKTKEAEEWFLTILKDLKIGKIHEKCVEYHNSKGEWMILDLKNGTFCLCFYNIWLSLRDTYGMDYVKFQEFTKSMLIKHLNWKVETTYKYNHLTQDELIKHLNWKVETIFK